MQRERGREKQNNMAIGYFVLVLWLSMPAPINTQDGERGVITSRVHDSVTFWLNVANLFDGYHRLDFNRNGQSLALILITEDPPVVHILPLSDESTVREGEGIGINNVQEHNSDIYTLEHAQLGTLFTWILYVLDMTVEQYDAQLIQSGSVITNDEFPNLSDDVIKRMQLSVAWYLADEQIGSQNLSAVARKDMHNRNLSYRITDQIGNTTQVDFLLNVAYIEGIELTPDQNPLIITRYGGLPDVQCTAECNPECDVIWKKDGSIVSLTGLLSLRHVSDVTGEYICLAANSETNATQTRNLLVQKHETEEKGESGTKINVVLAVCVGLLSLFSIALIAFILWWRLFRYKCARTPDKGNGDVGLDNIAADVPNESVSEHETYDELQTTVTDHGRRYEDLSQGTNEGTSTGNMDITSRYHLNTNQEYINTNHDYINPNNDYLSLQY